MLVFGTKGVNKTIEADVDEPLTPLAHGCPIDAEFLGHILVAPLLSAKQDDACSQRHRLRVVGSRSAALWTKYMGPYGHSTGENAKLLHRRHRYAGEFG